MSSVRSSNPELDAPTPGGTRGRSRRLTPLALALVTLLLSPLTAGCLERSTTVGDRYSGSVIVATSPDNPKGAPQLDIPESMLGQVSVTNYKEAPEDEGSDDKNDKDEAVSRVGTRASFSDLTAGQFGQLGDIISDAYGETSLSMDLNAKRSGEVVRFRGNADLSELNPRQQDYVQLTVTFAGPVTATNGDQVGESTVTWTPQPGEPSDFSADATYPDPATAAVSSWSWFLAIVCLLVVAVIVRMAYKMRYKGPRPGRPVGKPAQTNLSAEGLAAAADPTSPAPAAKGTGDGSGTNT
ncbi:LppM family (lipo)protein [Gordonia aurantiaca]|uniref:LppM family (lipo)protein n=1 Tax=Gordonia sp. B21 TaxID=3151852 RepID=UPI00326495B0